LSAVPIPDPKARYGKKRVILSGDVPSPVNPPSGCRFHTRCPYKDDLCVTQEPTLKELGPDHFVACHFSDKIFAG